MNTILLAGGGHSQLAAMPLLGPAARRRALHVRLLSPQPELLYSGMMPGWLAGRYTFSECAIPLAAIARRHGIEWIEETIAGVDFPARCVVGATGARHAYDVLALNVGAESIIAGAPAPISQGAMPVLPVKPFVRFVALWNDFLRRPDARAARFVVIGGGAAGFELACALRAFCRGAGEANAGPAATGSVTLVSESSLLASFAPRAARLARAALARNGIALQESRRFLGRDAHRLHLDGAGPTVAAEVVLVATGALPPAWLSDAARAAGVATAPDGGIAVDTAMRSPSHPEVFASGDCASFVGARVPRSGVHALRQGPPLAHALEAAAIGGPGALPARAHYRPQRHALALLDCGDGRAIGARGPFTFEGRWAWRWKDRIDRGFLARQRQGL